MQEHGIARALDTYHDSGGKLLLPDRSYIGAALQRVSAIAVARYPVGHGCFEPDLRGMQASVQTRTEHGCDQQHRCPGAGGCAPGAHRPECAGGKQGKRDIEARAAGVGGARTDQPEREPGRVEGDVACAALTYSAHAPEQHPRLDPVQPGVVHHDRQRRDDHRQPLEPEFHRPGVAVHREQDCPGGKRERGTEIGHACQLLFADIPASGNNPRRQRYQPCDDRGDPVAGLPAPDGDRGGQ